MDTPDVLAWRDGHIEALDQTALPHQVRMLRITTVDQLVEAITTLAVRGAPVLGAAGAFGVALAVRQGDREGWDGARLDAEVKRIADARPTAVNLRREVESVAALIPRACDGAAPFLISQGMADAVVVGADRVAANGDVANKIGTYGLALAAREAGIPFLVAAPESTLDPDTPTGAAIPIEQRPDDEVTVPAAPAGTRALNVAFDITPRALVTAIVTEERVIT